MSKSIQQNLISGFTVLAIGPMLIVIAALGWYDFRENQQNVLMRQNEIVTRLAVEVKALIGTPLSLLRTAAKSHDIGGHDLDSRYQDLSILLTSNRNFRRIVSIDLNGREDFRVAESEASHSSRGRDWSHDPAFTIPKAQGRPYYGSVEFDEIIGEPFMVIAVPVYTLHNRELHSVIASTIHLKGVWDLLAEQRVGTDQELFIMDEKRRVVAHQNPSVVLKGTVSTRDKDDGFLTGLSGRWVAAASREMKIGDSTFRIVAERNGLSAVIPAVESTALVVMIISIALVVIMFLLFRALRHIAQPIQLLAGAVQDIGKGDFSQRVEVRGEDEIGTLGKAFNVMAENLEQTLNALQNEVSERKRYESKLQEANDQLELRVVERTHALTEEIEERRTIEAELIDRTELLQLVSSVTIIANEVELSHDSITICLEKICAFTGWQVGHVYTLSPSDPEKLVPSDIWYLNGHTNFLSFREITEKTEFKKGVGLPGRVLASGKLEWIEDVTKDDNFPRAKQGRDIGVKTGIGLPIKIRGTVVAVMEFFSSEPLKRDILFLRSLEQIGTQIGRLHERAEARDALLDAKDKAETANRAKSDFLSSMAHELRTPLNAIIGFSGLIKEETFGPINNDNYREYLDDIHHSGQHLLGLINDVLDVSAIEANALELQEDNVSLTDIVEASIHLIKPRADDGGVSVSASIDPEIPPLYADGRRVKQVLLNLLSNAVKFTPEQGEVSISARLNDNGSLGLTVADTGIGMSEEEIETALSRFGQVDSGLDRKHEGTGLGLPLTERLMELHGGILEVQSEKGHGTRITATFPKERVIQNVC